MLVHLNEIKATLKFSIPFPIAFFQPLTDAHMINWKIKKINAWKEPSRVENFSSSVPGYGNFGRKEVLQ